MGTRQVFCPKCGTAINDSDRACSRCGAAVEEWKSVANRPPVGPRRTAKWKLALLLAVPAAFLILFIASFSETLTRATVSRVRTDMRSLGTAIEAYYADRHRYPVWDRGNLNPNGAWTFTYGILSAYNHTGETAFFPSFLMNNQTPGGRFYTLSTPVAYLTSYPRDAFSVFRQATFVYWSVEPGRPAPSGMLNPTTASGWILVSLGPDRDLDIADNWDVYDPGISQPSDRLLAGTNKKGFAFTYDPTNGTFSNGDIWRVKE